MKRKFIALLLTTAVTAAALVGCGGSDDGSAGSESTPGAESGSGEGAANDEDPESSEASSVLKDGKDNVITIVFPGNSSAPGSLEAVEAALTELARETVDCTVDLNILEWGVYSEQTNLMLSSGEDVDILFNLGTVQTSANSGQILDIAEMAPIYAPEAMEMMEQYVKACYVGDALYGFPSYHEFALGTGLVCRTDILEELGTDVASIKTWEDVDGLLEQVKEAHPELDVLVPSEVGSGMLKDAFAGTFDILQANIAGVYADGSQGLTAYNIYASDEFMDVAKLAYDWNQKGYYIADSTTLTDTRQTFLKAGSCFGYVGPIHPGTRTQESINAGCDVTVIPITDRVTGTSNVAGFQYTIPTGSDAPEKALAVLNMIYTNHAAQNLLHYGIEGTDYVEVRDGVAGYPEGVDGTTVGWTNETWLTGNGSIGLAWETDPDDIWAQYEEFNNNATFSPAYGFTFDSANVKTEITAVQNVLDKYTAMIYSGMADPEEAVAQFNSELEAAGMQNIVDEMQSQLDAWGAE